MIFHLAAGRGEGSSPDAFMNSAVTTRNLLEASMRHESFRRFVNVSSFTVYTNMKKPRRRERNAFKRDDLPRYYVPFTRPGWLAFSLGLHRRFAERIPGFSGANLRDLPYASCGRRYGSMSGAF